MTSSQLACHDWTYVQFMLELAGSSVVDWVQELVTKALSELRMSKHKTGQYAHNVIITMYQKWTHESVTYQI